uniref:Gamma-tubulin complex component n=1 Tax=Plectus sambesii TaxID=2011161 RepID=A0A914UKM5_9BILA
GIEGDHIRGERLSKTEIQWNVDPGFDPCLNSLIYKCLPLADARDSIVRFIEAIEWDHRRGRVARAVASTMNAFVEEDWMLAVMELETMLNANSLTVAEVYARTRLLQNALSLLADIAAAIDQQELVGGEILSLMDEKRSSNVDPHVIGLLDRLLEKAVVPYLRSLDAWVFYGQVDDVSLDFMIWDTENELMSAAIQQQIIPQDDLDEFDSIGDSFDRRYRLIGDLCPTFLRPVAQDILKCGKYLHIVDQCGVERKEKDGGSDKHLTWKSTGGASALVKVIEVARIAASVALVDILLKRYDLLALFRSVRRFLLVGQCDWLMIFMQVADDLLAKDAD